MNLNLSLAPGVSHILSFLIKVTIDVNCDDNCYDMLSGKQSLSRYHLLSVTCTVTLYIRKKVLIGSDTMSLCSNFQSIFFKNPIYYPPPPIILFNDTWDLKK